MAMEPNSAFVTGSIAMIRGAIPSTTPMVGQIQPTGSRQRLHGVRAVSVFLQIINPVPVGIGNGIRCLERVKTIPDFPAVRHTVAVLIVTGITRITNQAGSDHIGNHIPGRGIAHHHPAHSQQTTSRSGVAAETKWQARHLAGGQRFIIL